MKIHRFSHVMHITSIVNGEISENKDALDAIAYALPAGTLSGAPKIRACEIIYELEPHARGIYGGAIGYIDFSGNMDNQGICCQCQSSARISTNWLRKFQLRRIYQYILKCLSLFSQLICFFN